MNLWIKTICSDKITRDAVVRNGQTLNAQNFAEALRDACHSIDIPTPVFTAFHSQNIEKFNFVKFRPLDFVESVDFDFMTVELFFDK